MQPGICQMYPGNAHLFEICLALADGAVERWSIVGLVVLYMLIWVLTARGRANAQARVRYPCQAGRHIGFRADGGSRGKNT